jgi:hypothetical protein
MPKATQTRKRRNPPDKPLTDATVKQARLVHLPLQQMGVVGQIGLQRARRVKWALVQECMTPVVRVITLRDTHESRE